MTSEQAAPRNLLWGEEAGRGENPRGRKDCAVQILTQKLGYV